MLIDSHCHLDYLLDKGFNLSDVLNDSQQAGINGWLTISTKLSQTEKLKKITPLRKNLWRSVGIHPHNAEAEGSYLPLLSKAWQDEDVIGIGETGLDFYYNNAPKKIQMDSFAEHINQAQISGLPIIVHTRSATVDTADMLISLWKEKPFKGLIHCFTESSDFAKKILDIGMYVSLSGIATFKNSTDLQEIIKELPADRYLVETDSPFLAPVPYRGKVNQPAYMLALANFIAQLRKTELDEIAKQSTDNFFRLFSKVEFQKVEH